MRTNTPFQWIAVLLLAFSPSVSRLPAADRGPQPAETKLQRAVHAYFAQISGYQRGDLIDRDQVRGLLKQLAADGYKTPDPDELLAKVPDRTEWFVQEFRGSAAGRTLMRQIVKYPEAFDRMDRLSRLPLGKQRVREIIRGPDGYKFVQALTTSPTGKGTAKLLTNARGAENFDKPTGRLYTEGALLRELERGRR
jgi:hypothetical protein